jgi:hypothetical protein
LTSNAVAMPCCVALKVEHKKLKKVLHLQFDSWNITLVALKSLSFILPSQPLFPAVTLEVTGME